METNFTLHTNNRFDIYDYIVSRYTIPFGQCTMDKSNKNTHGLKMTIGKMINAFLKHDNRTLVDIIRSNDMVVFED